MFDDVLIESAGKDKTKGRGVTAVISLIAHIVIIGAIVAAGYYVKKNPEVIQKPIRAFMVSAPPPPPPPPPPAGASVSTPQPKVQTPKVEPQYTELARKARIEGIVIIEAIINTNGDVTDARVLKPLPLGLDQSALEAVKRWKFKPGTLNGQPVPVIYNLTVNFRLQ